MKPAAARSRRRLLLPLRKMLAAQHSAAFETTWRIAGSKTAIFGKAPERVIASEIETTEDYDELNRRQIVQTISLTVKSEERYKSGLPVTFDGIRFRIISSRTEGESCRLYICQNP